ncbi:MAG: glycosyltransferase family 2 protein [Candidatus Electrothrix gigas]
MYKGLRVVVVMPAYNAEKTVAQTYQEILEQEIVDTIILVDDASTDKTSEIAERLERIRVILHQTNKGYGANQKTCYKAALASEGDIVIMVHPDYQYTPKLIPAMAALIAEGLFDCVLGSRILGTGALKGGMPLYKYLANRTLTFGQNLLVGHKLSEYHTGYRAFSRKILETLHLESNSNDFVFDNQMLAQIIYNNFSIGEITCPTRYFAEASSISFQRAVKYGLGVIATSLEFRANKIGMMSSPRFNNITTN